jgi:hypothetical protein
VSKGEFAERDEASHGCNTTEAFGELAGSVVSSEAAVPNFLRDQSLRSRDVLLPLSLHVVPELPKVVAPISVRGVLIVSPDRVESTAQLVNQVVIVIVTTVCLSQVSHFPFCGKSHHVTS